ncbi:uncharacterized protein LOC107626723 [Arachis ipaensis]|uniref:uncharacterized protein LOC107626723 n=1 Tax=Arachis ipaensis TaxID=130454 RepID=UPI0007AFCDCD|nr:uncharacterized protein LOC107626723 [Arachis ipaensis]
MSIEGKHVCEDQVAAGVPRPPIRFRLHHGSRTSSTSGKYDSSFCKTAFSELVEEATQDGSCVSDKKRFLEQDLDAESPLQSLVKKLKVLDSDASNKTVPVPGISEQNVEDPDSQKKKKPLFKIVRRVAENKGGSPSFVEEKRKNSGSGSEFSKAFAELDLVEKKHDQLQITKCQSKREYKEQKLCSVDGGNKVLCEEPERKTQVDTIQGELNSYSRDLDLKKSECEAIQRCIKRHNIELKSKKEQLSSIEKLIAECAKHLKLKEEQCAMECDMVHKVVKQRDEIHRKKQRELEEYDDEICKMDVHLNLLGDLFRESDKQFVSTKKQLEERIKVLEVNENQLAKQMKGLELKERKFEGREKEFESKEKQFTCKELKSSRNKFECELKELQLKEEQIKRQVQQLKCKENQFEEHRKEFELKEKQLIGRENEFVLKKKQYDGQVKELTAKKKEFDAELEVHESRLKNFEGKLKEHQLKEALFESQVEELKSKENKFEEQTKELELKKEMLAQQMEKFKLEKMMFEIQLKELKSKEKQLDGEEKDLESKNNHFEGRLKEFEFKNKQYKALEKSYEVKKEQDNQPSSPSDGRSLQSLSNEQTNEVESCDNEVLAQLRSCPDPAKLILNILKNPIVPHCKMEDEVIAIDESQIFLLQQLMQLSPHIKPHVRDEAMELALNMKASMTRNIENPNMVLGFLQILSAYGLVSSFNGDEVFKHFEIISQHKQAVELFQMLGLKGKIFDLIENLIKNEKHIEAVRFICAYELEEKYQPIHLLEAHVSKAKLVCENSCNKTKFIEMKVKAMDKEIVGLGTVLRCMSENKLQYEDLLKVILNRILELERFKASSIVSDIMAFFQHCFDL